jgi:pimeloyl-ACP methyl ester carboxylesterase
MNVPVLVLLGFAAWMLLTLFGRTGVYRWSRILTGRASIAKWRADVPQGSDRYQRAMRAHMNCIENKLDVPVLGLGGEKSFGLTMATVMRFAASNVEEGVVPDSGHWIMEENPKATVTMVRAFS